MSIERAGCMELRTMQRCEHLPHAVMDDQICLVVHRGDVPVDEHQVLPTEVVHQPGGGVHSEAGARDDQRICLTDVVYGGGLKQDNAEMRASIEEIDGGLIALTRFQGEIGFYPDEYLEIIRTYLGK